MSRGHGRIERAILRVLSKRRVADTVTLARYAAVGVVKGPYRPTRSELESVRRALRNLRRQGLVALPISYPRRVHYERSGKRRA
jgi:hypothetical protein